MKAVQDGKLRSGKNKSAVVLELVESDRYTGSLSDFLDSPVACFGLNECNFGLVWALLGSSQCHFKLPQSIELWTHASMRAICPE